MTITIGIYYFLLYNNCLPMKNWTKKIFVAFAIAMNVFQLSSVLAADSGQTNILEALNDDNSTWASSITTTNIKDTSADIEFPVLTANNEQIMNYAISYVKDKTIASADLTDIKKVTFEGEKVKLDAGKITLVLDGLVPSSTYNFVVTPINKEGTELDLSDETGFKTLAAWTGNPTNTTNGNNDEPMLWAADTASANFTYIVDNSKVTVKWDSIPGASKFAFSMKEAVESNYTNVGEELITKESYTFTISKKGLFTVKIIPIDIDGNTVGAERSLSIKIDDISAPTWVGTPATGAGLNLILMSTFLMMLVYVVYRFRNTK